MSVRTRIALSEPHPHLGPLISSYQDGLATAEEADLVERHLLGCARCHSFYAGLQQAREAISDLPGAETDRTRLDATYVNIMQRIAGHARRQR